MTAVSEAIQKDPALAEAAADDAARWFFVKTQVVSINSFGVLGDGWACEYQSHCGPVKKVTGATIKEAVDSAMDAYETEACL